MIGTMATDGIDAEGDCRHQTVGIDGSGLWCEDCSAGWTADSAPLKVAYRAYAAILSHVELVGLHGATGLAVLGTAHGLEVVHMLEQVGDRSARQRDRQHQRPRDPGRVE